MRIAFIDHAYHEKTLSSAFFKEAVLGGHQIDEWWDSRWVTGELPDIREIVSRKYDLVIVWQSEQALLELLRAGVRDMVFVPMWDSCWQFEDSFWRSMPDVRIVAFCYALHERVRRNGLKSILVRYFPDPSKFTPVTDFSTRRGFFWQRRAEVTWRQIAQLIGDTPFERINFHNAPDPGSLIPVMPTNADRTRYNLTDSEWFERRADFEKFLAEFNIFFASRPSEGIGFSFLEAFAKGMCVVGVGNPTMSEYITDGVSGLLWDLKTPQPLDFSRAAEIGHRARVVSEHGYQRWLADLTPLMEFVFTPTEKLSPSVGDSRRYLVSDFSVIADRGTARRASAQSGLAQSVPNVAVQGGLRLQGVIKQDTSERPLITIATVTLNCREVLQDTLHNVLGQNYPNLEVIVIDGGSTDGTIDIIKQHDSLIDCWISEKDEGLYYAMNKAAALAHGRYILFMNAGDWFAGPNAIADAVADVPADADFIVGHHIYRRIDGVDELHKAADFDATWAKLRAGELDGRWLSGVPGHQSTFTRVALLREQRYDTQYAVAADHEFMYRQRLTGARFHHSDELVAVYVSGGMSWNNLVRCVEDWWEIGARYGGAKAAAQMFLPMKSELLGKQVKRKSEPKRNFVGRQLAARRLRRDTDEVRRSGLFLEHWYLSAHPDVGAARMDPVVHYLKHGADELRNPSPFFDTKFYLTLYGDVRQSGKNALLHYIRYGAAEGRAPNAWFDPARHLPPNAVLNKEPPIIAFIRALAMASSDDVIRLWRGQASKVEREPDHV